MGDSLEKINKNKQSPGNISMAMGALFSLSSITCPCPACIGASILFLANGIRLKLEEFLWK